MRKTSNKLSYVFLRLSLLLLVSGLLSSCVSRCEDEEVTVMTVGTLINVSSHMMDSFEQHSYRRKSFNIVKRDSTVSIRLVSNDVHDPQIQYASVWPGCEIEQIYLESTNIDSIAVRVNRPYNSNHTEVVTDLFVNQRDSTLRSSFSSQFYPYHYFLSEPPTKRDTFIFEFQLFDTSGRVFRDTSEALILEP